MTTFSSLIDRLGGAAAVARFMADRGTPVAAGTIQQMKMRDRVNVRYWPALIDMAAEQGVAGITYPALVKMTTRPARRRAA